MPDGRKTTETIVFNEGAPNVTLLVIAVVCLSVLNVALVVYSWYLALAVVPAFAWGMAVTMFTYRHRRSYHFVTDDIQPFPIKGVRERRGKRVVFQSFLPPLNLETREEYRRVCHDYLRAKKANSNRADKYIAPEIAVAESKLYAALQAWRLGLLDDRIWYFQTWDRLTGRWFKDETRYL